jgi:hypothetical protein
MAAWRRSSTQVSTEIPVFAGQWRFTTVRSSGAPKKSSSEEQSQPPAKIVGHLYNVGTSRWPARGTEQLPVLLSRDKKRLDHVISHAFMEAHDEARATRDLLAMKASERYALAMQLMGPSPLTLQELAKRKVKRDRETRMKEDRTLAPRCSSITTANGDSDTASPPSSAPKKEKHQLVLPIPMPPVIDGYVILDISVDEDETQKKEEEEEDATSSLPERPAKRQRKD